MSRKNDYMVVPCVELGTNGVFLAAVAGQWLLRHATPSWRIKKPIDGFQRVANKRRAEQIAVAVLNQGRNFPNAIVLATNSKASSSSGQLRFDTNARFLVVDGQHRLYAQAFSDFASTYACIIHFGLGEVEMAKLFLEINDNQKRVPSSLRWDLVRLVRPDDDPASIAASELVHDLTMEEGGPLFQLVDLTGESKHLILKQGSLAPEFRQLVASRVPALRELTLNGHFDLLTRYLVAVRELEPSTWGTRDNIFFQARVIRALLQTLHQLVRKEATAATWPVPRYLALLQRIDPSSLDKEKLREVQGDAGIRAIGKRIQEQVL